MTLQPPQGQPARRRVTGGCGSSSPVRRSRGHEGRAQPRRCLSRSAGVATPVSTSRLGTSARLAPSMSVSSRSPTTSGRRAPVRRIDSWCSAISGLPAATGSTPVVRGDDVDQRAVARRDAARRGHASRPGWLAIQGSPRAHGVGAPRRAGASRPPVRSPARPPRGVVGRGRPAAGLARRSAACKPSPPTTRTGAPAPTLVEQQSGRRLRRSHHVVRPGAEIPSSRRWAATASGVRRRCS